MTFKNRFIFTLTVTFLLMFIIVAYNTRVLSDYSLVGVYEDGDDRVDMMSKDLDNYLTMALTTLRVSADTIDLMEKNGASSQEIYRYLLNQTARQKEQFDENYIGIYDIRKYNWAGKDFPVAFMDTDCLPDILYTGLAFQEDSFCKEDHVK